MQGLGKLLKTGGLVLGGLLVVGVGAVYGVSEAKLRRSYDIALTTRGAAADARLIERGAHLVATRGCTDCHTADLGGKVFIDEPGMARVSASNLTRGRGGVAGRYEDADWERAIRHGVGPDGRALAIMPSKEYYQLGEEDISAMIAYLKSVPAVDRELPARKLGPIGRALVATGMLPAFAAEQIDHRAPRMATPPIGETAEYGRYVAFLCSGCHGDNYAGGTMAGGSPDSPPAANLTPHAATGLGGWAEADFFRAMREGRRPDGSEIDREHMPWPAFSQMTDTELRALWLYFRSLSPLEKGAR
jgi:mono/diheme cytochrome c family protein